MCESAIKEAEYKNRKDYFKFLLDKRLKYERCIVRTDVFERYSEMSHEDKRIVDDVIYEHNRDLQMRLMRENHERHTKQYKEDCKALELQKDYYTTALAKMKRFKYFVMAVACFTSIVSSYYFNRNTADPAKLAVTIENSGMKREA